jgi:hypothetical protein
LPQQQQLHWLAGFETTTAACILCRISHRIARGRKRKLKEYSFAPSNRLGTQEKGIYFARNRPSGNPNWRKGRRNDVCQKKSVPAEKHPVVDEPTTIEIDKFQPDEITND